MCCSIVPDLKLAGLPSCVIPLGVLSSACRRAWGGHLYNLGHGSLRSLGETMTGYCISLVRLPVCLDPIVPQKVDPPHTVVWGHFTIFFLKMYLFILYM